MMIQHDKTQQGLLVAVKRFAHSQFFIQATYSPDGEELIPLSFAVETWEPFRNEKIQRDALMKSLPPKINIFEQSNLSIIIDMMQRCSTKPEGSVLVYAANARGVLQFKSSFVPQKTRFLSVDLTISKQALKLTYTDDRAYLFHNFKQPGGTTWANDFALYTELVFGEPEMFYAEAESIMKKNDKLEKYVSRRQLERIWEVAHRERSKALFIERPDTGELYKVEPRIF